MREIKFRAWLKEFEFMIEPKEIGSVDNDKVRLKNPWYIENQGWVDIYSRNEVEVMQYTGLKDKHGKDIYEWDILQADHKFKTQTLSYKYKVIWNERGYWDAVSLDDKPIRLCYAGFDKSTIIGNIYEHPHLLESGDHAISKVKCYECLGTGEVKLGETNEH